MPPESVQIGPFVISKIVVDVFAPLLGTLIGGLIAYLATQATEKRKWEQAKKDTLQEQRREAIGLALEWLDPIRSAVTRASLLLSSHMFGRIDDSYFARRWPDLLSTLASKDLPPRMQVFLPPDVYEHGLKVAKGLEELRFYNLLDRANDEDEFRAKFEALVKLIDDLENELRILEKKLKEEYLKTFQ